MCEEHILKCIEPIWFETKLSYSTNENRMKTISEKAKDPITPIMDDSTYKCSCGKKFDNFIEAEKHIKEMSNKPPYKVKEE